MMKTIQKIINPNKMIAACFKHNKIPMSWLYDGDDGDEDDDVDGVQLKQYTKDCMNLSPLLTNRVDQ